MSIKSPLILFSCIIITFTLKGQNSRYGDSLYKDALTHNTDSAKVRLINNAVWELIYVDPAKAETYAKEALVIAKKTNELVSLSDCYNTLGSLYFVVGDTKQALSFHKQALEVRLALKDEKSIMKTYNNLAMLYGTLGNYSKEIGLFFNALKIAEALKDTNVISVLYNNISGSFKKQEQYKRAMEFNQKSYDIRVKRHDVKGIASCLTNFGNLYSDLKQYQKAENYFNEALKVIATINDKNLEAKCLSNFAIVYKETGRLSEALSVLEKSLTLNKSLSNKNGICLNYINFASVYELQKDYTKAIEYNRMALTIAKEIGMKQWEKNAYLGLSNCYIEQKDYKNAYESIALYSQLRDTLLRGDFAQQFNNLQIINETEKKEKEIKNLKQQEEINTLQIEEEKLMIQKRNYLLIASGIFILSIAFGGYFYFSRQKIKAAQKQEQAIRETEENERIRIAKDIHDDLGSGLSKIKFLTELVIAKSANNHEVTSSTKSISETATFLVENMRDLIWALNPENTTLISLVARIREYSYDYLTDFPIELIVNISEEIPAKEITKEASRNIFFILKESLHNIVKHANASVVQLSININDNKFNMSIKDNGKGLSDSDNTQGNGLKNIKQRAASLNSIVEWKSVPNSETTVRIEVSIKNIEKV